MPAKPRLQSNQFALLRQRRFGPFFWTQFLGAGNDNVFKFAFTVLVTYQLQVDWLPPALAGLLIGALFILPFLLFSATSGQLADKYDKARLMRFVKWLEVAIMALAGWGFVTARVPVLLGCVFLMGLHSTLFGPVKYAYLPQHLAARELTGGNGLVEMGTFVAILLGNLAGGLLIAIPDHGAWYVAAACGGLALLGRAAAQGVPPSSATDAALRVNWNPASETWRNLALARHDAVVFRSLLGISWMWFFGAVFLSQFPSFAKAVLHGDEHVASLLLVVFSIGIGSGSLLCESLSRQQVEIGLVPLGAIGMSVFSIELYFACRALPPLAVGAPALSLAAFLGQPAHWRVLADLTALALFAGLYSVPMYALIQLRSAPTHRARIVAANNTLNALFMVVSALAIAALLGAGFSVPQVFLVTGLLNAVVTLGIFVWVPNYLLRFAVFVLTRTIYRLALQGGERIPGSGAAILVGPAASAVDVLLLAAASARPIRFVVDRRIGAAPLSGRWLRLAGAIAIAPRHEGVAAADDAWRPARAVLGGGELLCIVVDPARADDGGPGGFDDGVIQLLRTCAVPMLPLGLSVADAAGSPGSAGSSTMALRRHRPFGRVTLSVGEPLGPSDLLPASLRARLAALRAG